MNEKLQELIDKLEHERDHADENAKTQIQQARITAEAQIAQLHGKWEQRKIDIDAEIERLEYLMDSIREIEE